MSRKPPVGEANLAALIAAVIGSIGGLFALGLIPAIVSRNPQFLALAPKMNVISFFLCGVIGWFLGGQLGPRLQGASGEKNGCIIGGIIGGLVPVLSIAAFGWYLATHPAS
jgi:hypothetical protein